MTTTTLAILSALCLAAQIAAAVLAVAAVSAISKCKKLRAQTERTGEFFRSLPADMGVCDRRGKVLFFQGLEEQKREVRGIGDIKNINTKKMSAAVSEAINTKSRIVAEGIFGEGKMTVIAPFSTSDKNDRAVWITYENSDYAREIKESETFAAQSLKKLSDLRETAKLSQAALDALPEKIFAKDSGGRYALANEKFLCAFKKTKAETIGKTDAELFGEQPAEISHCAKTPIEAGAGSFVLGVAQNEAEERADESPAEAQAEAVSEAPAEAQAEALAGAPAEAQAAPSNS